MLTADLSAATLRIRRVFRTPRRRVFDAWVDSETLKRWLAPPGCKAVGARIDLNSDGILWLHISSRAFGEIEFRGVLLEMLSPTRLAFTWNWKGLLDLDLPETHVRVQFVDLGQDGTEIRLLHEHFPNDEIRDQHMAGWQGALQRLENHLLNRVH